MIYVNFNIFNIPVHSHNLYLLRQYTYGSIFCNWLLLLRRNGWAKKSWQYIWNFGSRVIKTLFMVLALDRSQVHTQISPILATFVSHNPVLQWQIKDGVPLDGTPRILCRHFEATILAIFVSHNPVLPWPMKDGYLLRVLWGYCADTSKPLW